MTPAETPPRPAQQDWVSNLTIMQQSVLFASIRAPDGLPKNHPVKVLLRWYRRSILLSAFERRALSDPFTPGGGSFTGPFTKAHAQEHLRRTVGDAAMRWAFDAMREVYLEHVDEIPHHFQLHFMHAAQIVGFKHPVTDIRDWWRHFYEMIVNDAHLFPESEHQMDLRLGDDPEKWREREEVTAR